ncbi:hypothetical protein KI387_035033, partial [Taxus chinensis]
MSQGSPKQSGTVGTKGREPAEPNESRQLETVWDTRPKVREPASRIGRNENFCPGTVGTKGREPAEPGEFVPD